jgi:hypothetical protein
MTSTLDFVTSEMGWDSGDEAEELAANPLCMSSALTVGPSGVQCHNRLQRSAPGPITVRNFQHVECS